MFLLTLNKKSQKGASLIDSLWAILIITIVALAGAAFIFFATARVNMERNKRIALEMANTRIEEMKAAGFSNMKPEAFGYPQDWQPHIIKKSGGSWDPNPLDVDDETIIISGISFPITTTVQYVDDIDVSGAGYDYLLVVVNAGYKLAPDLRVILSTYIQSSG